MDTNYIKAKRNRIMEQIRVYHRKHYDARPLVKAYLDTTETLRKVGRCTNPSSDPMFTTRYWDNPDSYNRQSKNKNPIIGVDSNYDLVWAKAPRNITKPVQTVQIPPNPQTIKQSRTEPPKYNYYKINVSWTGSPDGMSSIVSKVREYFNVLELEFVKETEQEYGGRDEHTIQYKYNGTKREFDLLIKTSNLMLNNINPNNLEIAIYGNKYI